MNSEQLRVEWDNALIVDYRDPQNPNNKIVLTCEHATNDLPEGMSWSQSDQEHFANEHWGSDLGALEMAKHLASELKCVLLHSRYSRLLLDVNRTLSSTTLFRHKGDKRIVELNEDLTPEEEYRRIVQYHVGYHAAMREIQKKINPKYVFSIHSFTPVYEGENRSVEIGLLVSHPHHMENLARKFFDDIGRKGYQVGWDEPYDGKTGSVGIETLIRANDPFDKEGFEFEFRNDIIRDEARAPQIKKDMVETFKMICNI
jgi:predicted N-formylglutamate amidohydrolase